VLKLQFCNLKKDSSLFMQN